MNPRSHKRARGDRGYILLTLMLFVALLTFGLLAMVQNIETQIKRDREEELIHRGVQYSRAVRLFYVKFKRFPASVEELEDTNHIRFLRKRYKDPMTGKDFKLLHMNEVAVFNRITAAQVPPGPPPPSTDPGGQSMEDVALGIPPEISAANAMMVKSEGQGSSADSPDQKDPAAMAASGDASGTPSNSKSDDSETNGAPPLLGVPIVGVVSLSKEKTVREFNRKDHYNQWQFIFNPTYSTGGLINTPDQPPPQRAAQAEPGANQAQSTAGPAARPSIPNSQ